MGISLVFLGYQFGHFPVGAKNKGRLFASLNFRIRPIAPAEFVPEAEAVIRAGATAHLWPEGGIKLGCR